MAVVSQPTGSSSLSQQSFSWRNQSLRYPYTEPLLSIPKNSAFPVDCRGLLLLGYKASNGVVFCCVHQLAVELWKAFDTPRVSVQKKIGDLGIVIHHCDKVQVKMLRDAGIIRNFRATMIRYHDTIRLYDALEYSRKKRGLEKHALKANLTPVQRARRPEERRAKRLTTATSTTFLHNHNGVNSSVPPTYCPSGMYNNVVAHVSPSHKRQQQQQQQQEDNECALIGTSSLLDNLNLSPYYVAGEVGISLDTLLIAGPPEKAGGEDCREHQIQVFSLTGTVDLNSEGTSLTSMVHGHRSNPIQHMDNSNTQLLSTTRGTSRHHRQLQHSNSSTDLSDVIICDPPISTFFYPQTSPSLEQLNLPSTDRQLNSPDLDSSDCEEVNSSYSRDSSHRLSSTPERFLRLDDSSEQDSEESEETSSESEVFDDEEYIPPKSVLASTFPVQHYTSAAASPSITTNSKKTFGTKLRHYAHTSSPNITRSSFSLGKRLPRGDSASDLVTSPPCKTTPLVISVPISMLATTAHQRSSTSSATFMASSTKSGSRGKRGRPPKNKNKPTALSSFVTKKRASSRSSSTSSERSVDPLTIATIPKTRGGVEESGNVTSNNNNGKVAATGSQSLSKKKKTKGVSLSGSSLRGKTVAEVLDMGCNSHQSGSSSVGRELHQSVSNNHTRASESVQLPQTSTPELPTDVVPSRLTASRELGSGLNEGGFPPHQCFEDDQISVASSSMHSAHSKGTGSALPLMRGRSSERNVTSVAPTESSGLKSTFKFEEMFSYFPPKLVIKDGELQPEHSLSVKNLDRQGIANLPQSHPFLNWTLGQPTRTTWTLEQPTRTTTKCPRKRKAGSSKTLCT